MSHVLWGPSILSDGNKLFPVLCKLWELFFLLLSFPGLVVFYTRLNQYSKVWRDLQSFFLLSFSLSSSLLSSIFHKSWTLPLHWTLFFCLVNSGTRLDYVWVLAALPMMQSQCSPVSLQLGISILQAVSQCLKTVGLWSLSSPLSVVIGQFL